jgi:hypothetical protein
MTQYSGRFPEQPKSVCEVCNEPGVHNHRYQYCIICLKETEHVTVLFGLPWVCAEAHADDDKVCARCRKQVGNSDSEMIGERSTKKFCAECSGLISRLLVSSKSPTAE